MANRTAYVGTQVAGDVLTAANFTKVPGGWIGYAEVTANQVGITSETDLTGLTVTVTVGSNRRIRVSACVNAIYDAPGSAGLMRTFLHIKEGASYLGGARWALEDTTTGTGRDPEACLAPSVVLTPSAGSHTYKLAMVVNNGGGSCGIQANANFPSSISVEDIGPAS